MSKHDWRLILCLAAFSLGISLKGGPITSSGFTGNTTLINFDNLAGGNCNLCGPSVIDQYANLGVTFNNPTFPGDDTADTNLTSGITNASLPNSLYVYQGGQMGQAPAAPFQILFSVPVTQVGFDFGSSTDAYLELQAYGADDQLLETLNFVGSSAPIGLAGFAGLQETTPIVQLDVSYHPNSDPCRTLNFSIDNLQFGNGAVPEPSTIALIASGLIAIVLRLGTRKN